MSVELSGFDELISDLNNLGAIGNKIGRKAVEEGAKIVLEQQKKDAPRSDDNDPVSYTHLTLPTNSLV